LIIKSISVIISLYVKNIHLQPFTYIFIGRWIRKRRGFTQSISCVPFGWLWVFPRRLCRNYRIRHS